MNKYQTDILCTYKQLEDEYDQEELYRIQFLQIFNLEDYDDTLVNAITKELYEKIFIYKNNSENQNQNKYFREILNKAKENNELAFMLAMVCPDGEKDNEYELTLFRLLFKFEYFDLFHKCISEYLRHSGVISLKTKDKLLNAL